VEFFKVQIKDSDLYYWVWLDEDYFPYLTPSEKDISDAPKPLLLRDLPPDYFLGFDSTNPDCITNTIPLTNSFESLKINPDLRKDLRRIEKINASTRIIVNEENALEKSAKWFLEQWKEPKEEFERRLEVWKGKVYTLSAYLGNELLGVHIAMKNENSIYYLGCWWNRERKNFSIPTFLCKRDIEDAIKNKFLFYDLGVGTEPYKKKWGVIEKPAKYYAELPAIIAEKLELKKYIEMK